MLLSDVATLGDKIDIKLVQQLEQERNGELKEPIRVYKSVLYEFVNDKEIEIAMPTENGRMVLFQIGLRCHMQFYCKRGLYTCVAIVQKRFKKDNFFVLQMHLTQEPKKFQRREFFRVETTIDMHYMIVGPEFLTLPSTEEVFEQAQKLSYEKNRQSAITVDISGGGIKFAGKEKIPEGSILLISLRLTNDKFDQSFFLVTQIIESIESPRARGTYITRGKFSFKDLKDREDIVRYVFEEERRIRRKEMV